MLFVDRLVVRGILSGVISAVITYSIFYNIAEVTEEINNSLLEKRFRYSYRYHQCSAIIEEFSYITDKWIYLGICINEYENGRGNERG